MIDCDSILEQLNDHFDGVARVDVDALRQRAAADRDCLAMFDALMDVHALFTTAPMAHSSRDFATSVIHELARRKRRQRWAAMGVILLGAITLLLPLLTLAWAGAAFLLQPGLVSQLISNALSLAGRVVAFVVALLSAFQHLPPGVILTLTALFSLSALLLALASAYRVHPEFVRASSS